MPYFKLQLLNIESLQKIIRSNQHCILHFEILLNNDLKRNVKHLGSHFETLGADGTILPDFYTKTLKSLEHEL